MCSSRTTTKVDSLRNVRGVKSAKKVGNNTFEVIYKDGCKAIRLHRTDVVTFRRDGGCVLNTDGWQTRTTKDRMNKYSPVSVYQVDSIWYVAQKRRISDRFPQKGEPVRYYDYMVIDSCGTYQYSREQLHNHEKGGLELC